MRVLPVAAVLAAAALTSACGFQFPAIFDPPSAATTADAAYPVEVVSFTQVGSSLSVRLRNPNTDVGLIRSAFELALIDDAGRVIATEGQGGLPGTPVNTIYQLPPGGEYGLESVRVPNGKTVASVELTVLGQWFKWDTVDSPLVTVTDVVVPPDSDSSGPSVTGRLALDKDGPLNVVVIAFVETSAGTVVSRVLVDCVQAGQRRTFEADSYAFDARGPYRLDKVVAYATAIKGTGPQFEPRCSGAADALPPVTHVPTTRPSPTGPEVPSSATSQELPRLSDTSDAQADRPGGTAHLAAVRLARGDGYDRLVFEFTDRVPSYAVGYRPMPAYADPSGNEIPLPGANAAVRVTLTGVTGNGGGSDSEHTYFGPTTVTADTTVVTEAKAAGDFEAVVSWVVGVRSQAPFSVLVFAGPPRLVIDFKH